jgi:MFS superfamily sulfate permease-like transporter
VSEADVDLASLALFVYRRMWPRLVVVEPASAELARELPQWAPQQLQEVVGVVRFDASLVFVNVSYFEDAVLALEQRYPRLRFVIVSALAINSLDASGVEMLTTLIDGLGKRGITLIFSGVKPQVHAVLERTGLIARIGEGNLFASDDAAYAALGERLAAGVC